MTPSASPARGERFLITLLLLISSLIWVGVVAACATRNARGSVGALSACKW